MIKLDKETKDINGGYLATSNVKIAVCPKCQKVLILPRTAKTAECSCGNKFTIQ